MKLYYDKHRKHLLFKPGTLVLLSTKNLHLPAYQVRKITPRYVGPFKVLKQVGKVSYKLELPENIKVHNVFHISLLK
jgi:hypothetical protein